ncbi:hypothetical protein E2R25_08200 [Burkholderia pseudomallei]|nr:hypothetical protein E2R25_08200 [Burkholderia pseudomallei]
MFPCRACGAFAANAPRQKRTASGAPGRRGGRTRGTPLSKGAARRRTARKLSCDAAPAPLPMTLHIEQYPGQRAARAGRRGATAAGGRRRGRACRRVVRAPRVHGAHRACAGRDGQSADHQPIG